MQTVHRYPLLRLLIVFVAGIILALKMPGTDRWTPALLALSLVGLPALQLSKKLSASYRFRWLFGVLLSTAFFSFGCLYTGVQTDSRLADHFTKTEQATAYACVVRDGLSEKAKSYKTTCEVQAWRLPGGRWQSSRGRLLVYLHKDAASASVRYGDRLFFAAQPRKIPPPGNPGEFDYKQFLANHGIYRQVYLQNGKWHGVAQHDRSLRAFAITLRERLVKRFGLEIGQGREHAVASALVLGFDDHIDPSLQSAYAGAGVIHVLAVSGLHVGIIFLALSMLLGWMNRWRFTRHLKPPLLILLIWFYAMLTGFSPSVLRASAMLSFIIVGTWTGRDPEPGNGILASAFFLLLCDPYLITQAGFQLSYLAVYGIIYVHPHLFRLFEPSGYLVHKTWELASVSASAQLMTFPLAVCYFHQFPNLFFVSNLLMIPLATAAIYSGMLTLFLTTFGPTLKLLTLCHFGFLHGMNHLVLFVERIPYAVSEGLSLSGSGALLVYFIIGMSLLFCFQKHSGLFVAALGGLVALAGMKAWEASRHAGQKMMIVYQVRGHTAVDFISGRDHCFVAGSSLTADGKLMEFHIRPGWWKMDLRDPYKLPGAGNKSGQATGHFRFLEKDIFILDRYVRFRKTSSPSKIKTDFLILAGNRFQKAAHVLKYFDASMVIIDSSYPAWRAGKIRNEFESMGVPCRSVPEEGAFKVELQTGRN